MKRYETDAILAHPELDAPRLELAAALEHAGDPRGEFIRLQLQLESAGRPWRDLRKIWLQYEVDSIQFWKKCEANVQLKSMVDRERILLQEFGEKWCPGYCDRRPGRGSHQFRRGFVEGLAFTPQEMVEQSPQLFLHYPLVQSLALGWSEKDRYLNAVTLALSAPVQILDLSLTISLHPETITIFAEHSSSHIRILRIPDCQGDDMLVLTNEQLQLLSETRWIHQLERLYLCWDGWTEGFPMVRKREEQVNAFFSQDLCQVDCCM